MHLFKNCKICLEKLFIFIATLSFAHKAAYSSTLKYSNLKLGTNFTLITSQILHLLRSFSLICVYSPNKEMTTIFTEICRTEFNTVMVHTNFSHSLQEQCNVVVVPGTNVDNFTAIMSDVFKLPLYIINYFSSLNLTSVGRCLTYSRSPEVVAISLSDRSVLELSSVYTPPRHFTKSSVAEVIDHRRHVKTPDFKGSTITGATTHSPPFTIISGLDNSENYDGIEMMIFKEMAQQLNFTIKYHVYEDRGFLQDNGTFKGGIGQAVTDGTAELAISDIWQLPWFYTVVDYGPSLFKNRLSILVRRPQQIDLQLKVFRNIFQREVWLATFATFVLVLTVHRALHSSGWIASFLSIFGHFTMMSSYSLMGSGNSRTVLTSWSVFSLLLASCLSSGIVSRLTLTLYSPRVDTLQQLVEENYYWTAHDYVKTSQAQYQQVISNFESPWFPLYVKKFKYLNNDEIHKKVESDEKITFPAHVYSEDLLVIKLDALWGNRALRRFRLIKESVTGMHVTFGVRKHSPYLDPLTKLTHRFIEAGLVKYWQDQVISRWPEYDSKHLKVEHDVQTFSEPQPLRLNKTRPVFYLLLLGLGLGFVVFVIEVIQ